MTDLMYEQLPGHVENSLLDLKPAWTGFILSVGASGIGWEVKASQSNVAVG